MNEVIIYTQAQSLAVNEYNGQRVVTFKDIDALHQRREGTARKRFFENKRHFIEGEDYFFATSDETLMSEKRTLDIANRGQYLFTQMGYLMLTKSFKDDLSWHIQRQLVRNYFDTRLNGAEITLEQRNNAEGTYISTNNKSLETAYFNAINKALNNGYYLRRQRRRERMQDETKLLGTYDGDFYYIIHGRAYDLYATSTDTPAPMRGLNAYLFNGGYLMPNSKQVDKYGTMTHKIGINGKTYSCLAFYANKVHFTK